MGIIKAIINIPLIIWLVVIGVYTYYNYNLWETETLTVLQSELENSKQQLEKAKADNKAAEAFDRERERNIRELQQLAENFNQALEKLPKTNDIPGVLTSLAEISDRSGIDFSKFEPGTPEMSGFLVETPFKIELKGTFVQILSFLDEVANLKRIISSRSVSFKSPIMRGSNTVLSADVVLVSYHFDESGESAKEQIPAPVPSNPSPSPNEEGQSEE